MKDGNFHALDKNKKCVISYKKAEIEVDVCRLKLTIGERLKDLRVAKKLTLEQLSTEVGISKSALGKYESDNGKDISPYSISMLADYYGVSSDYLMGRTETKKSPKHSSA